MENRQGEGKNSVGNVEAKELTSMTHGHELWGGGGNVGERGWVGWRGVGGGMRGRKGIQLYLNTNKNFFKKKIFHVHLKRMCILILWD